MSLKAERIKVGNAEAAEVVAARTAGSTVKIKNIGEKACVLGGTGVEAEDGFSLEKEAEETIDVLAGDALMAICAEGETELASIRY